MMPFEYEIIVLLKSVRKRRVESQMKVEFTLSEDASSNRDPLVTSG